MRFGNVYMRDPATGEEIPLTSDHLRAAGFVTREEYELIDDMLADLMAAHRRGPADLQRAAETLAEIFEEAGVADR